MTKYKVYTVTVDEEDGTWWRKFLGHVVAENRTAAMEAALEKFGGYWNSTRVFSVGTRVKLRGCLSEREHSRLGRSCFEAMSRDEQDAYVGR